ncbi:MAG TPA: hypothetical protein DCG57_11740 [Candidatus Riflebacteria bacterium]|nr:hypothetical protein [Candidatus Riflebacteria bacterium]
MFLHFREYQIFRLFSLYLPEQAESPLLERAFNFRRRGPVPSYTLVRISTAEFIAIQSMQYHLHSPDNCFILKNSAAASFKSIMKHINDLIPERNESQNEQKAVFRA